MEVLKRKDPLPLRRAGAHRQTTSQLHSSPLSPGQNFSWFKNLIEEPLPLIFSSLQRVPDIDFFSVINIARQVHIESFAILFVDV